MKPTDKDFERVNRAVTKILERTPIVAPVDVFVELQALKPESLAAWRKGEVPCLERVITMNLSKTSRILRSIANVCRRKSLTPSRTVYVQSGGKKRPRPKLRFSTFGDPNIEAAYSTHWISEYQIEAAKRQSQKTPDEPISTEQTESDEPDGSAMTDGL